MTTYRAAYWTSEDRQSDLVLTTPEEAHLPDEELLRRARAEAERTGTDLTDGTLSVGEWRER